MIFFPELLREFVPRMSPSTELRETNLGKAIVCQSSESFGNTGHTCAQDRNDGDRISSQQPMIGEREELVPPDDEMIQNFNIDGLKRCLKLFGDGAITV